MNIPCEICGKTYSSKKTIQKHMRTHDSSSSSRYKCDTCGIIYTTALGFRCHLVRHAKSEPDMKCDKCGKLFYTRVEVRNHINSVHMPQTHTCEICGKNFTKPSQLKEHVKVKHEKIDLQVPCSICGKTYATKSRMMNHILMLHNDVQCTECGQTFSNKSKLRLHRLTFHQNLRYKCIVPGCFKEYMRKAKVNDHFALKHTDLDQEVRQTYLKILKTLQPT